MTDCARGCTIARQHVTACEDDDCRGCKPREAHHGLLCNGCHARLVDMLDNAPKQHRLLLAMIEPAVAPDYSALTTAKIGDGWRTDSEQPHQGPHARPVIAGSEGGAPLRMAALEAGQELSDMLYRDLIGIRCGDAWQFDIMLGRWRPLSVRKGWRREPGLDLGICCIRWGRIRTLGADA